MNIENALKVLRDVNAVDTAQDRLTPLGRHMVRLQPTATNDTAKSDALHRQQFRQICASPRFYYLVPYSDVSALR